MAATCRRQMKAVTLASAARQSRGRVLNRDKRNINAGVDDAGNVESIISGVPPG